METLKNKSSEHYIPNDWAGVLVAKVRELVSLVRIRSTIYNADYISVFRVCHVLSREILPAPV